MLEATSTFHIEKSLIKAATQSRLRYESIRTALLTMHEDRDRHGSHPPKGRGRSFHVNWAQDQSIAEEQYMYDGNHEQFQSEDGIPQNHGRILSMVMMDKTVTGKRNALNQRFNGMSPWQQQDQRKKL